MMHKDEFINSSLSFWGKENRMKYKAVIFDLFGTLVDIFSGEEYDRYLKKIAVHLKVDFDSFRRVWYEITYDRNTGVYPTSAAVIDVMCEKLGIKTSLPTAPKNIGKWDPGNFKNGTAVIKLDVTKLVRQPGRYFVVLEYVQGGKVRVESIDLVAEDKTGKPRNLFKCGTHKLYVYRGKGKAAECPFLIDKVPQNENLFVVVRFSSNKPNSGIIKIRGNIK